MPKKTPSDDALASVAKAGKKYARAQAARDAALADLQEEIRAAAAVNGTTKNAIIAAAGVGRQTVYDALHRTPAAGAEAAQ